MPAAPGQQRWPRSWRAGPPPPTLSGSRPARVGGTPSHRVAIAAHRNRELRLRLRARRHYPETAVPRLQRSAEHPAARERSPAGAIADGGHAHAAAALAGRAEKDQQDAHGPRRAPRGRALPHAFLPSMAGHEIGHFWSAMGAPLGSATMANVPLRTSARGANRMVPPSASARAARPAGSFTIT